MFNQTLNVILSEKERRGIDLIQKQFPNVTLLNVSADIGHVSFLDRGSAKQLLTRGYREALRVLTTAKQRGVFDASARPQPAGA
jgi:NTE family protein